MCVWVRVPMCVYVPVRQHTYRSDGMGGGSNAYVLRVGLLVVLIAGQSPPSMVLAWHASRGYAVNNWHLSHTHAQYSQDCSGEPFCPTNCAGTTGSGAGHVGAKL